MNSRCGETSRASTWDHRLRRQRRRQRDGRRAGHSRRAPAAGERQLAKRGHEAGRPARREMQPADEIDHHHRALAIVRHVESTSTWRHRLARRANASRPVPRVQAERRNDRAADNTDRGNEANHDWNVLSVQHKGGPRRPPLAFLSGPGPKSQAPSPLERHAEHQLRQPHEAGLRADLAERGAAQRHRSGPDLHGVGEVQHFELDLAAHAAAEADVLGGRRSPSCCGAACARRRAVRGSVPSVKCAGVREPGWFSQSAGAAVARCKPSPAAARCARSGCRRSPSAVPGSAAACG